jgi:type I restriction enzyme M protein
MLDTETKRRIDTARDILVGKVPDPKSQVEQITIALIYKFMDDMDAEAEELGGKRKFFSGDFSRYGWKKLMAPNLGGFDVLTLYAEAIQKLNVNPNIPQLFRDIFKNAYLPYRDPETLKSFLKIIDDFEYDHSEKLGDAFEYLLSVLGSQGDAGQFRTPRHIIDFMVELVDPKKNETILDPACGTAGFLISSYKHIVRNNSSSYNPEKYNTSGNGNSYNGDKLTPDERKKLAINIKGYDISPDMVRLSLVNLYLHGFTNPLIVEYDTLTSEDKWNEYADIILANPPFMSPKGGIKPHKRFSVESSRSEVLFVDYIAEHLTPSGRAAVIVPEGIIFQSGTAYKTLRKMLIEKFLYAVVSLPAGVFNPYAGVKTSILLMDKMLSKRTNNILFAKIDNDGFDLGAQRRANDRGELPFVIKAIKYFVKSIIDGSEFNASDYKNIVVAPKEKIGENEDWNLSGERYKKIVTGKYSNFSLVAIGEVCQFEYGKPLKQEDRIIGDYPVYGSNGIVGYHNKYLVEAPFLVVGRKGSAGEVHFATKNGYPIDTTFYIRLKSEDKVQLKYLFHILKSVDLKNVNIQAGIPGLNRNDALKIQIPLPPLDVQKEIVTEIECWQKIIDGARQVIDNYKPHIKIENTWPKVELKEVCRILNGRAYKQEELLDKGKYLVLRVGNFFSNRSWYYSDLELEEEKYCQNGDLLYAWSASFGPRIWEGEKAIYHYHIWKMCPDEVRINKYFLCLILDKDTEEIKSQGGRGIAMIHITKEGMEKRMIPVPPLDIQLKIVGKLEKEQHLIDSNKQLITLFQQKIKDKIASVWGE